MASRTLVLYVGMTNDVYRRALEHKAGEVDGFTKRYNVNRLVYYESFQDVGLAIEREKQIKGWSRQKKLALIQSENPTWIDLAEDWGKQVPLRRFTTAEMAEMQIPRGLKPARNDNLDFTVDHRDVSEPTSDLSCEPDDQHLPELEKKHS
jgi:putative endonuclease